MKERNSIVYLSFFKITPLTYVKQSRYALVFRNAVVSQRRYRIGTWDYLDLMIGRIGSIHVRDGGLKQWPLGFHVHHSNGSHKNLNDEKKTLRLKVKAIEEQK